MCQDFDLDVIIMESEWNGERTKDRMLGYHRQNNTLTIIPQAKIYSPLRIKEKIDIGIKQNKMKKNIGKMSSKRNI